MLPFILREKVPDDHNFLYNSFLKSYHASSSAAFVPKAIYYKGQAEVITWLLEHATTLVICFPEEPEQIMGYLIYQVVHSSLIIHFLYIKSSYRKQGMAKQIVDTLNTPNIGLIVATHITNDFHTLRYKIGGKKIVYDPFFITTQRLNEHR